MIVFILLWVATSYEISYIGSHQQSVRSGQVFEQQFFDLAGIEVVDLFQSEPPYNKLEDQHLNCYWTQEEIGLKEQAKWRVSETDSPHGGLLCVGREICYFASGRKLYILDAAQNQSTFNISSVLGEFPLPFPAKGIVDLSSVGLLAVYSPHKVHHIDITNLILPEPSKIYLPWNLQRALQEAIDVYTSHETATLYVNVGEHIEIWVFEQVHDIRMIGIIFMDKIAYSVITIHEHQRDESDHMFGMAGSEGYLYIFCMMKGFVVYDISDPYQVNQVQVTNDMMPEGLDPTTFIDMTLKHDRVVLLHNQSNYSIYDYDIIKSVDLVTLKLRIVGDIPIPAKPSRIRIYKNNLYILEGQNIILSQLERPAFLTQHQKKSHAMRFLLRYGTHLMPDPLNYITVWNDNVLQIHDFHLKTFRAGPPSQCIVCVAPENNNLGKLELQYLGILQSEQDCSIENRRVESQALMHIAQRERLQSSQCLYAFEWSIHIIKEHHRYSNQAMIIMLICSIPLVFIAGQYVRDTCRSKMVSRTLQRFEELNNQLNGDQKERIRITHHTNDSDDEEWRESARIPVKNDFKAENVVTIQNEELL